MEKRSNINLRRVKSFLLKKWPWKCGLFICLSTQFVLLFNIRIWNYPRLSLSLRNKRGSTFSLELSRFRDGILLLQNFPLTQTWENCLNGQEKKVTGMLNLFLLWLTWCCLYLFSNTGMVSWWNFYNWKPATHLFGFSFRHSPCNLLPEIFLLQT